MQLSRTALRLAMVETLAPFALYPAVDAEWPTLAQGRVFDSDIGPAPATEAEARLPRVAVYTDDGVIERGGEDIVTPFHAETQVTLAFEIFMPGTAVDEHGMPLAAVAAPTDALAEAMLELIGAQIHAAVEFSRMSGPLAGVLSRIRRIETRGWRDADTDVRLSSHRLEYEVTIPSQRGMVTIAALPVDAPLYARLPWPLCVVAAGLPEGSYGRAVCDALAAVIGNPATLPALADLRFAANLRRGVGDAAPPPVDPADEPPVGDLAGSVSLTT